MDRGSGSVISALIGLSIAMPLFAHGDGPAGGQTAAEDYARFASTHHGDPVRGRALFGDLERLACARCHRAGGQGGEVGPDLSDIGGKFDRSLLVESILEPSRQIVEGYRTTTIALLDGRVLTGIARDETAEGLLLIDADGRRHTIRAAEIENRRLANTSLMPSGLAAGVSPAEFADLIAYLETLRSTGPITLPQGFTWSREAVGITGATAMAVAPDGRVFVCEQTGSLRVVKRGRMLERPFLTLRVDSNWERGLIGVALDPGFARNSFVYVNYVAPEPYPHHRVSRFVARGDVAAANSETILLEGDDQTKARRSDARRASGRGDPLRQRWETLRCVSASRRPGRLPRRWIRCWANCSGSTLTARFRKTIRSTGVHEGNIARSGRWGCETHSRSPCSRRPAGSSSTTWARPPGRRSTKALPAPTTAGRRARGRQPTRGSAGQSTTIPSPRLPAAHSVQLTHRAGFPAGSAAGISSPIS